MESEPENWGLFQSQLSQLTRETSTMSSTSLRLDFIRKMGMPTSRTGDKDYGR